MMTKDLLALFAFRDLRAFPLTAMHLIMAARLCIIFGQAGRDPLPDLAVRLRSMDAARQVMSLVQGIQQGWPDKFLIHRPCCMTLSPDEAILGDLAVAALQGNEESAMALLRDTLPADISRYYFREAVTATAAIRCAQLQPHRPGT